METNENIEIREKEPTRKVVLHLIRHGEAIYKDRNDKEGSLTEEGKLQAEELANKLFTQISPGEVVKFYSSPLQRTRQTAEILRKTIESKIKETGKEITVLKGNLRTKTGLVSIDLLTSDYWQLKREGIKDPVQYWLDNLDKSPQEALVIFENLMSHFQNLALRIAPQGPNLHLICVTHGGNPDLFLKKVIGLTPTPTLQNCEVIQLNFSHNPTEKPKIIFRSSEYQTNNEG